MSHDRLCVVAGESRKPVSSTSSVATLEMWDYGLRSIFPAAAVSQTWPWRLFFCNGVVGRGAEGSLNPVSSS